MAKRLNAGLGWIVVPLLGMVVGCGTPAFAQSGIEASKEMGASRDMYDEEEESVPDVDLGNNPLDRSGGGRVDKTEGVDPYASEGGALTLMNCSGRSVSVNTYNSNDAVLWVPFQTKSIGNGSSQRLSCATSSCKLIIGNTKTGALSGYRVLVDGKVQPTNSAAVGMGCTVY